MQAAAGDATASKGSAMTSEAVGMQTRLPRIPSAELMPAILASFRHCPQQLWHERHGEGPDLQGLHAKAAPTFS